MTDTKHKPTKDRRNIGEVRTLVEEMAAARAASASCVHVDAALEPDTNVSLSKKKSPGNPAFEAYYDRNELWPEESLARRRALFD